MPKITITDSKGLVQSQGLGFDHKFAPVRQKLVADAANDTTVTSLASGDDVYFGTTTGLPGAGDGNNAFTFKLPTPTGPGEVIRLRPMNAAAYGKLLGFSVTLPASETIRYIATEAGAVVETATTTAGVNGTANTMVKINGTHFKIGDVITCTSLSTTVWLMEIVGGNGLIAAEDIAPDPGNAAGHID